MQNQTLKTAIKKTVDFWAEKAFKALLNQDNGDKSSIGGVSFMLMNMVSMEAQKGATDEKIEKFKTKLSEIIEAKKQRGAAGVILSVDYSPCSELRKAAIFAELSPSAFPCKSCTRIEEDNKVMSRFGYGSPWKEL